MRDMILTALVFFSIPLFANETLPQLEARLKRDPSQTKVREEVANEYVKKKNDKKVIEILAPYSNEISDKGLIVLSETYERQKDYINQIRTLQIYENRNPNRFRPQYLLGVAFSNNKQFDEAVQSFRKSVQFAPQHRPSYDGMLKILLDKKDQYEARTLLSQMIAVFGDKADLLSLQCRLYSEGGFLAEAEATCKKAIVRDRTKPDNHVYLARTMLNQGRKQAAESVFKKAARKYAKSELVQFATGEFYFNEKNYAIAVRYLTAGIKLEPNSARSRLGLALSLFEVKKFDQALEHFTKACELDETRVAYNDFRSAAAKLRQNDDYKMAQKYERKIATCR